MKFYGLNYILWILGAVPSIFGANILGLFPYPGKSHFDFFHPLFLSLANTGHNVTVVSYFPNKQSVVNYTDLVLDGLQPLTNIVDLNEIEKMHFWFRDIKLYTFFALNIWGFKSCEAAFESETIKSVLESSTKYDVILTEFFVNDCMLVISHKLKAPVIGLTSHALMPWHYKRMGSPFLPSFMPNHFLEHSDQMGLIERLNNFLHQHLLTLFHNYFCHRPTNTLIRKHFGDSVPPIEDLVLNTSLMLINQHFSLNGATPYVPGIVEVGGLHVREPKPLDLEIKQILDNAENGVIYISWGSLVRPETMSSEKKNHLIKALSRFNETILLKWPNTSIPNPPKNFYLRDWMPQMGILCHPNVKVFMSHGGLLGSTEASYCGVSLVITPLFGDQFVNAKAIQARKAGVILNYRDLEEHTIVEAIQIALSPKMQKSAKFISEAFRNRPQTPLKLATWWVENTIRTKGAQLGVNASSRMNWVTYNNLDVYTILLVATLLPLLSLMCVIRRVCIASNKNNIKHKAH